MNNIKNFPKSSTLLIAIVIGVLAGVGVYQAAARGLLPLKTDLLEIELPTPGVARIVEEESAVIEVVESSSPSVVAIGATRLVYNPFDPFSVPRNQSSTIGTGFVIAADGVIVTNRHVVDDPSTHYSVVLKDGKKYEVRKIYKDPVLDLAIVSIDADQTLKPLEVGDSSKLKVGQSVIAIGNALGKFTNTVTTGVVSGLGRQVITGDYFGNTESLEDLIQTDAAINPGNSGGPLLNSSGQVIGINVATTEGAQNIGFAIPINAVKKIVDEFSATGSVSRAFLGVRYQFLSKEVAVVNELPQGAYIREVVPGSAASIAGLKAGEVITKIDSQPVVDDKTISSVIASKKTGDSLSLVVWNGGKERTITATLQELPSN